jgi:hypothetical protein
MSDTAPITLQVNLTPDDHTAWFACYLERSPHARKTVRNWQAFLAVVGGVFPIAAGIALVTVCCPEQALGWLAMAYGAGYLLYIAIGFPPRYRKRWLRKYRTLLDSDADPNGFGESTIELGDSEISASTKTGHLTISLARITDTVETSDYLFLFLGKMQALIVPKRGIAPEQFAAFRDALDQRRRVAPTNTPAP